MPFHFNCFCCFMLVWLWLQIYQFFKGKEWFSLFSRFDQSSTCLVVNVKTSRFSCELLSFSLVKHPASALYNVNLWALHNMCHWLGSHQYKTIYFVNMFCQMTILYISAYWKILSMIKDHRMMLSMMKDCYRNGRSQTYYIV